MICQLCGKKVDTQKDHIEVKKGRIGSELTVVYHFDCWVKAGGK